MLSDHLILRPASTPLTLQAPLPRINATYLQLQISTDSCASGAQRELTFSHAVIAVGYGTDATYGAYYLVRNSWGTSWGEKGYVRLGQASGAGVCGIN